ncbi:NAD(P)/FAD-dependent oxidoreductase [Niallia taxi]|uniref:NAD(P)/FAD-dependent oxidoreductase n=1 Tax=Niallia taxi TaxID=2499688 RepID=UPI0029344E46|nr:NAD(P)/FAD-dependent oxidoreductase [Niallia taxi]WOD63906.1 NAD(P)/FAD-dependent oxidoreductase [Niallia taxi]
MKKLIILGGGYGGMTLLSRLISNLPYNIMVILIDKAPYHFLKTEFYALAAGTVSDEHIRVPFPKHPQVSILNAEVASIDRSVNAVNLVNGESIEYDDLVIGLGCEDNFHGITGAAEFTHSIQTKSKTQKTYTELNNLAAGAKVAIIGGGLSGVELASELAENRPDLNITLFDRGSTILSSYPPKVSAYVEKWFEDHHVDLHKNSNITLIEENTVFNKEEPLPFDCIVWTAGVMPSKIVADLTVAKDKKGRILLTDLHHLPADDKIFVVGDCASLNLPPSAQLAEKQAEQVAAVLIARWKGAKPPSLPPIKLKGILGSLGKKHGFGLVANTALTGRIPRILKHSILWKDKNKKKS